jgi:hypothetical protein
LRFVVGAALVVDRALDALADQIGLRLDVDRALPLCRPILGLTCQVRSVLAPGEADR